MSNTNDLFDLFSYFDGDFSEPSAQKEGAPKTSPAAPSSEAPAATETAASTDMVTGSTDSMLEGVQKGDKVVHLASSQLREQRQQERPEDACEDECDSQEEESDEDQEALAEDSEPDEAAADRAELAGGQANTEVKADQKTAANNVAAAAKKEEKKPEFNHATYIAYAGNSFLLSKFFEADKLAELDLEAVRKRLERDFPELSKQRTKMEWDEKKNLIIPMVTGGKKGSFFSHGLKGFFFRSKDLFENKEPINILAARDGYYELRENAIGVFIAKAPVVDELEPCREGFKMSLPKIPGDLFAQLVTFFADYAARDDGEVEVMGVFYWDTENKRYVLDVPKQRVSKSRVIPTYTEFPPHFIRVAEIHSHNTMDAFFSPIDDEDEKATMLYGVVGKLRNGLQEITYKVRTRAGMAGRFIPLEPEFIIEGDFYSWPSLVKAEYPDQWHDRVTISKLNSSLGVL
ncbi:hypothetical protein [Paenibacillus gansuensis]|uniref:JAB domain-containing protein n=1 Tax=Paenibacillus gansuensis TaxID=306542 RepID=A0ABW5PJT9_9BACL